MKYYANSNSVIREIQEESSAAESKLQLSVSCKSVDLSELSGDDLRASSSEEEYKSNKGSSKSRKTGQSNNGS